MQYTSEPIWKIILYYDSVWAQCTVKYLFLTKLNHSLLIVNKYRLKWNHILQKQTRFGKHNSTTDSLQTKNIDFL